MPKPEPRPLMFTHIGKKKTVREDRIGRLFRRSITLGMFAAFVLAGLEMLGLIGPKEYTIVEVHYLDDAP